MYHYVHDRFAGSGLIARHGVGVRSLSVVEFENQLDRLCASLEPIGWPQFIAGQRGEINLPPRSFLLTFDDGLREHVEIVQPILERRRLKGVFFVPGCVLAGTEMLTAHAVHLLLEVLGEDAVADEIHSVLSNRKSDLQLATAEIEKAELMYHYESARLAHLKFLINMKLPLATRASVVRRLFEKHIGPQAEWAPRWYLTADQVRQMHSRGHTVGGHSFAHEPYGRLDNTALERDVSRCALTLRELLRPGERPFAYPFGSTHPAAEPLLKAAGFVRAFGTTSAWATPKSPAMNLPRLDTIHVTAQLEPTPT